MQVLGRNPRNTVLCSPLQESPEPGKSYLTGMVEVAALSLKGSDLGQGDGQAELLFLCVSSRPKSLCSPSAAQEKESFQGVEGDTVFIDGLY